MEEDFAVAAGIVAELGFGRSQSVNTNVSEEILIENPMFYFQVFLFRIGV